MKELEQQFQEKLEGLFTVKSIQNVNHKPHIFMLGPNHISFASDTYSGILGDACITDERFPTCSHPGCSLRYKNHTSDKVLMLSLSRELSKAEAQEALKSLPLKENNIDGVVLVETPEKYRII